MGLHRWLLLLLALVCGLGGPLRALAELPQAPQTVHTQGTAMPCHDVLDSGMAQPEVSDEKPCPHCLDGRACGQCGGCWLSVSAGLLNSPLPAAHLGGHGPWFAPLKAASAALPQAVPTPPPRNLFV